MAGVLLQTKLFVPPLRPDQVRRPHLIQLLDEGLDKSRALTLVSAPAGYGKTSLIVEWLHGRSFSVAWLSLDREDNEPARFFAYLFAALRSLDLDLASALEHYLQGTTPPAPHDLMAAFINQMTAAHSKIDQGSALPWLLVLDDYQAISNPVIHESIDFLLERFPPGLQLALLTRQDPPIALARLRGRDLITELRQDDLRFSGEEIERFLVDYMGQKLSEEEIEILGSRTEGWVAGLQLAAISMRGLEGDDRSRFIDEFSGVHRHILDYLANEVLDHLPAGTREFLSATSILDRMCADLCAALWGPSTSGTIPDSRPVRKTSEDAQQLLENLEQANVFVVPLDNLRQWYRYHHLFAELLRARLHDTDPKLEAELHGRAARWHEEHGLSTSAVQHSLLSGDMERAADTIGHFMKEFDTWSKVQVATFLGWLQALPQDILLSRPWLQLFMVRSLYVSGETEKATRALDILETWLEDNPKHPETAMVRSSVRADQASFAVVAGRLSASIIFAENALADLPDAQDLNRVKPLALLGLAYYRRGELSAAEKAFRGAVDLALLKGLSFGVVPLMSNLAEIYFQQGRLSQVLEISEQAIKEGAVDGSLTASTGFAFLEKGKVAYERNDLPDAEENLARALDLLGAGGIAKSFGSAHGWLAAVKQARGDPAGALDMAQEGVRVAEGSSIDRIVWTAKAFQARIWLTQGLTGKAVRWAEDYARIEPVEYLREFEDLTLASVHLATGMQTEAVSVLDRLQEPAVKAGRYYTLLHIHILRAVTAFAQGDHDAALVQLSSALKLAEPEGFRRPFLDQGRPMANLLQGALRRGLDSPYGLRLLQAFDSADPPSQPGDPSHLLVEPLTDRELEVLALLAQGLSNKEIGRRLFLSPHTVRSHTYNIYGKLGVHSRTQAVAKARELDLLP